MADEHRSDDEVLADLERGLAEQDPGIHRRFADRTVRDRWPTRALTLTWLVWTTTWFVTYLATDNPASLVLAATSGAAFPASVLVINWWQRHDQRP